MQTNRLSPIVCLLLLASSASAAVNELRVRNMVDGGLDRLLNEAAQPSQIIVRDRNGKKRIVPRKKYQTTHAALTGMSLISAGYDAEDHTAEGFMVAQMGRTILHPGQQNAAGFLGGDGSRMYGHGLILLAMSEFLLSQPVDDRTKAEDAAFKAARFAANAQRYGGWSIDPPANANAVGTLSTIVSALQVVGLRSFEGLGKARANGVLSRAERLFAQSSWQGGQHHDGTFRQGQPLPSEVRFLELPVRDTPVRTDIVFNLNCRTDHYLGYSPNIRYEQWRFHSFEETGAGALAATAFRGRQGLDLYTRKSGLDSIIAEHPNGRLPLLPQPAKAMPLVATVGGQPRVVHNSARQSLNQRWVYQGLGTLFLAWANADPKSGHHHLARRWIENALLSSQQRNGAWVTHVEPTAGAFQGWLPSTAFAVMALTAKDQRLPMLAANSF